MEWNRSEGTGLPHRIIGQDGLNLLGALPEATLVVDHIGIVRFVNYGFEKLTGLATADILGRPLQPLFGQGQQERWQQLLETGRRDRASATLELVGAESGRQTVDVVVGSLALETCSGAVVLLRPVVGASARLNATDTETSGSERRPADSATASTDWWWETDADLRFSLVTGPAGDSLVAARISGRRWTEVCHGDPTDGEWQRHLADLEARRPFRNLRCRLGDEAGESYWVRVSGVPVFKRGIFAGYRGSGCNIPRAMEGAPLAVETRFRLIAAVQVIDDGFALFDADRRLLMCNDRCLELVPQLSQHLQPGASFECLARLCAASGTFPQAAGRENQWVAERLAGFDSGNSCFELQMRDGRWLLVRDRRTSDGCTVSTYTDITELKRREHQVQVALEEQRALMEAIPDAVFVFDVQGRLVKWNRTLERVTGLRVEELRHKPLHALTAVTDKRRCAQAFRRCLAEGQTEITVSLLDQEGNPVLYHCVGAVLRDADGQSVGIIGVGRDVDAQHQNERRLRQAAKVFEGTTEGVMIADAQGHIIAVNEAFAEITGYAQREVIGQTPRILKSFRHGDDFYKALWSSLLEQGGWQGEIWNRRKDGEIFPEWLTINSVYDEQGRIENFVAVFSDISAMKQAELRLQRLAHHDALTDLPNRLLLADRLQHAIERAHRDEHQVAVLFLDLDRFKVINDTLGHPVGDRLLQEVASRLATCVREDDTVARLGGDEFVVVIEEARGREDVEHVVRKLLKLFHEPFRVDGRNMALSTSIGISLYPRDGTTVDVLLKRADAAMYQAKQKGRNISHFYTEEFNSGALQRFLLEASLRRAVAEEQFTLHFQPRYQLESGMLVGAEAHIRWEHPQLGLISPQRFIPLAEEMGLAEVIGEWVLRSACRQMKRWQDLGHKECRVAVSACGLQIQRRRLIETVQRVLLETGLEAGALDLEIMEDAIVRQLPGTLQVLTGLRGLGVNLVIGEFGSGGSSLSYLKKLPLDKVKIARSFVGDIPQNPDAVAIVRAIVGLAHGFDLGVVADGVASAEQQAFLRAECCDGVQGPYCGGPMPAEFFLALLERGSLQETGAVSSQDKT